MQHLTPSKKMPTKYNPSDFENELKYVEAELGFELEIEKFELNDDGNLIELSISNGEISDVGFLENLTSLTYLDLSENKIKDISALNNLTT